jgi:5'-3' exonuclease
MVAMALLIGSDHDLHGVPGFGLETALRFVQLFAEDEILDKYVSYFLVFSFRQNNLPQCCIHGASHLIYTSPGYMKLVEGCIPS